MCGKRKVNAFCKYLKRGYCKYGTHCRYRHGKVNHECRYHKKGCCTFGERCWFKHVEKPSDSVSCDFIPEEVLKVMNVRNRVPTKGEFSEALEKIKSENTKFLKKQNKILEDKTKRLEQIIEPIEESIKKRDGEIRLLKKELTELKVEKAAWELKRMNEEEMAVEKSGDADYEKLKSAFVSLQAKEQQRSRDYEALQRKFSNLSKDFDRYKKENKVGVVEKLEAKVRAKQHQYDLLKSEYEELEANFKEECYGKVKKVEFDDQQEELDQLRVSQRNQLTKEMHFASALINSKINEPAKKALKSLFLKVVKREVMADDLEV